MTANSSSHSGAQMRPGRWRGNSASKASSLGAPISPEEMLRPLETRSRGLAAPSQKGLDLIRSALEANDQETNS